MTVEIDRKYELIHRERTILVMELRSFGREERTAGDIDSDVGKLAMRKHSSNVKVRLAFSVKNRIHKICISPCLAISNAEKKNLKEDSL